MVPRSSLRCRAVWTANGMHASGADAVGAVLIADEQAFTARDVTKTDARPGNYEAVGGHGGTTLRLREPQPWRDGPVVASSAHRAFEPRCEQALLQRYTCSRRSRSSP